MKEAVALGELRGSMQKLALKFNIHCSRKRTSRTCARGRDKRHTPS